MTVLNGVLASPPIGVSNNPALVGSLSDFEFGGLAQYGTTLLSGQLVGQYPVSTSPLSVPGSVSGNFGNDFFDYFTFDPVRLDAGFINATSNYTVKLWNRNPYAVEISAITGLPDGVTLSVGVGDTFDRFQERAIVFTVNREGAAVASGTISFEFDNGDTASIEMTGIRARLWPYSPNWSDNYVANYAYKTESVTSRNGKEQRRSLRHNPRFYSEFAITLADGALARFEAMMAGWQSRPFVVPDYTEYTSLLAPTAVDDETFQVTSVPEWLVDQTTIVIGSSVYLATDVSGSTVTVTPRLSVFQAGEQVTLGRSGQISASSQNELQTNTVGKFRVRFDAYPRMELPITPPSAALTFNGREVLLKRPNWSSAPQVTYDWPVESVDFGRGRSVFFQVIDFAQRSLRATYTAKTPSEVQELRNFFDRMRGMRGEFYTPTWNPDMELVAPVLYGSSDILVSGTHVYEYLRESSVHKCIAVVLSDGSVLLRKTSAVSLSGDNTLLTVTNPLPAFSEVTMICWLNACALSSDILTVTWLTDTVAQIGLSWRTLEDIDV